MMILFALTAIAWGQEFQIQGTDFWLDTKIDLRPRDELKFTATGELTLASRSKVNASGAKRGFRDMIRTYPVNDAGQGALIGRIGESASAVPFLVGPSLQWTAPRAGRLFLGINKAGNDAPKGTFTVKIEFTKRAPEKPVTDVKLPVVTLAMVDGYPRRIQDAQGNAGDNTNFLIVGTEKQVQAALKAAGWLEVDRSHGDAVTAAVGAVLSKKAYVTLPMSELMLFGRVQDHGYAQADPIQVIAERHHFRIWKAPFTVEGYEAWVGAGTHDIGFDRDNRNNGVTHKIDPDVDKERDYIGQSLQESGMVAKLDYVMPSKPSQEAVTATGATFRSDGRVLVIYLAPDETTVSPVTPPAPEAPATEPAKPASTSIFDGLIPKP